jgi:hypothetical protein
MSLASSQNGLQVSATFTTSLTKKWLYLMNKASKQYEGRQKYVPCPFILLLLHQCFLLPNLAICLLLLVTFADIPWTIGIPCHHNRLLLPRVHLWQISASLSMVSPSPRAIVATPKTCTDTHTSFSLWHTFERLEHGNIFGWPSSFVSLAFLASSLLLSK